MQQGDAAQAMQLRGAIPLGLSLVALTQALSAFGIGGLALSGALTPHASNRTSVTIEVEPLRVSLYTSTSHLRTGNTTTATVQIKNDGMTEIRGVTTLLFPQTHLEIVPSRSQSVGTLAPGATKRATWTLCATAAATYLITARASGTAAVGVVDYDRTLIQWIGTSRRGC
jgi:hypothetical protein